jgi:hypothetical protein
MISSGCAILRPVATPEQVSEQLDQCAAKAQQEVVGWKPADPTYTTASIEDVFQLHVNICMNPFYAEQRRRQANIDTQAAADRRFWGAFAQAIADNPVTVRRYNINGTKFTCTSSTYSVTCK